jgi:hypothetical protein
MGGVGDTELGQVANVAIQVTPVGGDSVPRHAALDGEVVEIGLDEPLNL